MILTSKMLGYDHAVLVVFVSAVGSARFYIMSLSGYF